MWTVRWLNVDIMRIICKMYNNCVWIVFYMNCLYCLCGLYECGLFCGLYLKRVLWIVK